MIPTAQGENLFDIPTDALQHTIATTQRVAQAVKSAFTAEGIMIAQLNGAAAGQTVFHLHFHIIPRSSGADFGIHARDMEDGDVLAGHASRIIAALENPNG